MPGDQIPAPRSPHPSGHALPTATLERVARTTPSLGYVAAVLCLSTAAACTFALWSAVLTVWAVEQLP